FRLYVGCAVRVDIFPPEDSCVATYRESGLGQQFTAPASFRSLVATSFEGKDATRESLGIKEPLLGQSSMDVGLHQRRQPQIARPPACGIGDHVDRGTVGHHTAI